MRGINYNRNICNGEKQIKTPKLKISAMGEKGTQSEEYWDQFERLKEETLLIEMWKSEKVMGWIERLAEASGGYWIPRT